jgi:ATP-binding cassette subfamily B (MDR/TAP) protein 1
MALDKIMVGRTSVIVAHRLSTVRNADMIALVYRGSILEKGSHDELMAVADGGYTQLVRAQMRTATRGRSLGRDDSANQL